MILTTTSSSDLLKGPPSNEKEEVGACLLDKIGAIVSENGVEEFLILGLS